ncbi:hypothetical protein BSKO_13564 [Bryopsis sp. KO-2023]|nr:hypothetical protein BSKO_13564 [Bryopsis sp. KO-2023]
MMKLLAVVMISLVVAAHARSGEILGEGSDVAPHRTYAGAATGLLRKLLINTGLPKSAKYVENLLDNTGRQLTAPPGRK